MLNEASSHWPTREEVDIASRQAPGLRDDMREPGEFVLRINGYRFDCVLKPHGRDVRLWHVIRDGEVWLPSTGLERMWRAVQAEMASPLGRAHWGG